MTASSHLDPDLCGDTMGYAWDPAWGDYYDMMGLRPVKKMVIDGESITFATSVDDIRRQWRKLLSGAWPGPRTASPGALPGPRELRFRALMEAWLCLSSPSRREAYDGQIRGPLDQGGEMVKGGHDAWIRSPDREPYVSQPLPDWQHLLINDVLDVREGKRGAYDDTAAFRSYVATQLDELPQYLRHDRISAVGELDLDTLTHELVHRYEVLDWLATRTLDFAWRRNAWASKGATVLGQVRSLSKAERQRWPHGEEAAPVARIELALDHWLAADEEERADILYHELCHLSRDGEKVVVIGHDVEAFVDEIRDRGIGRQAIADLIGAALERPALVEELARWGVSVQLPLPFAA